MLAIVLGLARFEPLLDGRQVLLRTDNQVVLSYLRRRDGLASPELRSLVRAMLRILLRNRARLVAAEWLTTRLFPLYPSSWNRQTWRRVPLATSLSE
jgi:hypothetical protein